MSVRGLSNTGHQTGVSGIEECMFVGVGFAVFSEKQLDLWDHS